MNKIKRHCDLLSEKERRQLEEDLIWVKIAEERDKKTARFVSHSQAWRWLAFSKDSDTISKSLI